jgi:hypothetical protein
MGIGIVFYCIRTGVAYQNFLLVMLVQVQIDYM